MTYIMMCGICKSFVSKYQFQLLTELPLLQFHCSLSICDALASIRLLCAHSLFYRRKPLVKIFKESETFNLLYD